VTVTNPANGKSVKGMGQTTGEILKISDDSFVDHPNGITLNFILPGLGGVLQVIGSAIGLDSSSGITPSCPRPRGVATPTSCLVRVSAQIKPLAPDSRTEQYETTIPASFSSSGSRRRKAAQSSALSLVRTREA
jgi:hypothetical protein